MASTDSPVWSNTWNPETDEWSPSDEPYNVVGEAGGPYGEPTHYDTPDYAGSPSSEQYGHEDGGTVAVHELNLIDDVKQRMRTAPPPQVVHHVIETFEEGAELVRARVVRVVGNQQQTMLLEENPNRRRALIKCITTAGVVMVQPAHQGGNLTNAAIPTGNQAAYPQATGDPVLEVKSQAGVEAYGIVVAPGFVDVAVWEEMTGPKHDPGLV
jgi:hypothetical protein